MNSSSRGRLVVFGVTGAAAVAVLALLLAAHFALPGMIRTRVEAGLAGWEGGVGSVAAVRVCVPCGSYTLESFELRDKGSRPETPSGKPGEQARDPSVVFAAREVVVSVLPGSLLRLAPVGAIQFEGALLRVREGKGATEKASSLNLPLRRLGEALLPLPLERLSAEGGEIELRNDRLDPPVVWSIEGVSMRSTSLSEAGERSEITATGRTHQGGRAALRLTQHRDSPRFDLEGTLRGVPMVELNDYMRNALGIDFEAGSADVDLTLGGDEQGTVRGEARIRVAGLDVLDLSEFRAPRLGLVLEGLADLFLAVTSSDDQALQLRVEIEERIGKAKLDPWSTLGTILRRSVVALLRSPASAAGWVGERIVGAEPVDP